MPNLVAMYRSIDGENFETVEKACEHELDLFGEEFDGVFKEHDSAGRFTRNDIYRIFVIIAGTHKKAITLRNILNRTISDISEIDE